MNIQSFRFKIALLSGLITGSLLVGSGIVLWQASYRFSLDRLDREILNLGTPHLERVLGGDHWTRFEGALRFIAGNKKLASYILWVQNEDRVVYNSPDWPGDMHPDSFPDLVAYENNNGPSPEKPPPPPPRRGEEISPRNPALPRKVPQFYTRDAGGRTWRVGVMGNPYMKLILCADINDFNARLHELRNIYLAVLPVVLLLVGIGAWFLAQRALRPVTALAQTVEGVTAKGLSQRIPPMTCDQEFNRLILVFNEMMNRLQKSFDQATRFSADASHELKTPLARLQVELEQAVENSPSGSSQQEIYSSLLDEVSRLKAIVQKLLLLSLADAGRLHLHCEPVNLSSIMDNVIEDCQAQATSLTIEKNLTSGLLVNADPDLLEQALQNLASNAVKYNQEDGRIRFELLQEAQRVIVNVANTGPGIPETDHDRIFQRFYRADRSRSNRVEGVGLGLSLSREILRAHGGDLFLSLSTDSITQFTAWLPVRVE